MTNEKRERALKSAVSIAIVMLVLFLSIAIYQAIRIGVRKRELSRLEKEISLLQEQKNNTEDEIERWLLDETIEERARELGLRKKS
ncbi:MAG TPA: hypothetical protein DDY82_02645 [Clostridiales bacterium]|nr:hypothetical protein [Clostridiales bacterium]HBJ97952.1 hypothetical protein [Clostridiales bacterium]